MKKNFNNQQNFQKKQNQKYKNKISPVATLHITTKRPEGKQREYIYAFENYNWKNELKFVESMLYRCEVDDSFDLTLKNSLLANTNCCFVCLSSMFPMNSNEIKFYEEYKGDRAELLDFIYEMKKKNPLYDITKAKKTQLDKHKISKDEEIPIMSDYKKKSKNILVVSSTLEIKKCKNNELNNFCNLSKFIEIVKFIPYTNKDKEINYISIGNNNFKNNERLRKIIAPNVVSMGHNNIQGNPNLISVNFDSLTNIKDNNFSLNKNLSEIEMKNLEHIGSNNFEWSKISSIYLPLLRTMENSNFKRCSSVEKIIFDNLERMNNNNFNNCSSLQGISFDNLRKVGNENFVDCILLTSSYTPAIEEMGPSNFSKCPKLKFIDIGGASSCLWKIGKNSYDNCNLDLEMSKKIKTIIESTNNRGKNTISRYGKNLNKKYEHRSK